MSLPKHYDTENTHSQVSAIVPTIQIRDFTTIQTKRLLDRFLQELDDENTNIDDIEKVLTELSLKSGIDYDTWSEKCASINLETGEVEKHDNSAFLSDNDLLYELKKRLEKNDGVAIREKEDSERSLILSLLQKETKLSQHYESLLKSYENLLESSISHIKERREQTYGVYYESENDISSVTKPLRSIQSIQITQSLNSRAKDLKRNAELLKCLTRNKKIDLEIVKSSIAAQTVELAKALDEDDD